MRTEHSRALRLATAITALPASQLETRLDDATVTISIDSDMPQAALVARVLLTTLRRGPGHLLLVTNNISATLIDTLQAATTAIDPTRPLRLVKAVSNSGVRVHVGAELKGPGIRLVPDGCGAHLANDSNARIRPFQAGNPLGAIYTAGLGAAEVFKYTADVITARRVIHRHLTFCPVALSTDLRRSPTLKHAMQFDLALIGIGAIGTAIALILSELDAEGVILAVDRQRYAHENRGTYSLGGDADTRTEPWKADLAAQTLTRFTVTPFTDDVDTLIKRVDSRTVPWFPTVLTALDSPEARRVAQRLWPDRLIDAATGDTMLGLHDHRHGVDPCMFCHFPLRIDQPSGAQTVADRLGLPAELLADGDAFLTTEHIDRLGPVQRDRLTPHLGTRMCGLARATGLSDLNAGTFMPSIPFVSMQAACLSVGRLIASNMNIDVPGNLIQYDSLVGPHAATIETMRTRPGCTCTNRSTVIDQVRHRRSATPAV